MTQSPGSAVPYHADNGDQHPSLTSGSPRQPTETLDVGLLLYANAGWPAFPLPPGQKFPPAAGRTGAAGVDAEAAEWIQWIRTEPLMSNVGIRMPVGVVGIDVDAYVKAGQVKSGDVSLAEMIAKFGMLPPTWSSTSRGYGLSRIWFYRIPADTALMGILAPGIDAIQHHHRYAVAWPSTHPDTGQQYRWYAPDGSPIAGPPNPADLPELPQAWINAKSVELREGRAPATTEETKSAYEALYVVTAEPCRDTKRFIDKARDRMQTAVEDGLARHDTMTALTYELAALAMEGHTGYREAEEYLYYLWSIFVSDYEPRRKKEFWDMVRTGLSKVAGEKGTMPLPLDPCVTMDPNFIRRQQEAAAAPAPEGHTAPATQRPRSNAIVPMDTASVPNAADAVWVSKFLALYSDRLRYVKGMGWIGLMPINPGDDTQVWQVWKDEKSLIHSFYEYLVEGVSGSQSFDEQRRVYWYKSIRSAAGANRLSSQLAAACGSSRFNLAMRLEDLDAPALMDNAGQRLNIIWANGWPWDLRASLTEPTRADGISTSAPHMTELDYAPDINCPTPLFDRFMKAVLPDPRNRDHAMVLLGAILTGEAPKMILWCHGDADTGKTRFLTMIQSLLGEYATTVSPKLLGHQQPHGTYTMQLRGKRFGVLDEAPSGARTVTETLKAMSGGGDMSANLMHQDATTFGVTHVLAFTSNDFPPLRDDAMRSRLRPLPFGQEGSTSPEFRDEISAATAPMGSNFDEPAWLAERPGVLAQIMRYAAYWLANRQTGVDVGPLDLQARYLIEADHQNVMLQWSRVELTEGSTASTVLYTAFSDFCKGMNERPYAWPSFNKEMTQLGYRAETKGGVKYWNCAIKSVLSPALTIDPPEGPPTPEGPRPAPAPTTPAAPAPATPRPAGLFDVQGGGEEAIASPSSSIPSPALTKIERYTDIEGGISVYPYISISSDVESEEVGSQSPPSPPSAVSPSEPLPESDPAPPKRVPKPRVPKPPSDPESSLPLLVTKPLTALSDELTVTPVTVFQVPVVIAQVLLDNHGTITVDVEHTGYPIGHNNFRLKTVQLGDATTCVVLDATDPIQVSMAVNALNQATEIVAHLATADLVPIATVAGLDPEQAGWWDKVTDTGILAALNHPEKVGRDLDLKTLTRKFVAGSTAPEADVARKKVFAASNWKTKVDVTTPIESSGWAQIDATSTVMARYAASDVLDTAALAAELKGVDGDNTPRVRSWMAPLGETDESRRVLLDREREFQKICARLAHRGLRLDPVQVSAILDKHTTAAAASREVLQGYGIANVDATADIGAALEGLGAVLPKTPTGKSSTTAGVVEKLSWQDDAVGELAKTVLSYRHDAKLVNAFLTSMQDQVVNGDGRVRPTILTLGAQATGRTSCVRPNAQQVPRKGGVRECLTADPGWVLVAADFSSIEVRVAAWLSQDLGLAQMIREGLDLHSLIAREVWGEGFTDTQRYSAKRLVFGKLYGAGVPTLTAQLGREGARVHDVIDAMQALTPQLTAWSSELQKWVRESAKNVDGGQWWMHDDPRYPRGQLISPRVTFLPGHLPHVSVNYAVQSTARELMVDAALEFDRRVPGLTMLTVHDELVVHAPEPLADVVRGHLAESMTTQLPMNDGTWLPVACEADPPSVAWKSAA